MSITTKRYFNNFELVKNSLTKTSKNAEKLVDEINWFLNLPKPLNKYTPLIKDYSLKKDKPFLIMEYSSNLLLADAFINEDLTLAQWSNIFKVLFKVQEDMGKFGIDIAKTKRLNYMKTMYITKTEKRLKELFQDSRFKVFFEENIVINSKKYHSLNIYLEKLESICQKFLLKNIPEFNIVHGDFILANILMNLKTNEITLVDPRGSFGISGIYGDPRYEYGKLLHSLNGYYELIINDKFEVSKNKNAIKYSIPLRKRQKNISKLFMKSLRNHIEKNLLEIELIEALLFLSMVPLHADSFNRQIVMLAQGVKKFHPFVNL
jgi:hypothetical protein